MRAGWGRTRQATNQHLHRKRQSLIPLLSPSRAVRTPGLALEQTSIPGPILTKALPESLPSTVMEGGFPYAEMEMRPSWGGKAWGSCGEEEGEKPRAVWQPVRKVSAQKQAKALGRPPPSQVPRCGQRHTEAFRRRTEAWGPRISHRDLLVLIHSTRDMRVNQRSGSFQSGRGNRPKIRKP